MAFIVQMHFDPRPLEIFKTGAQTSTILAAMARAVSKSGGDAIRKVRVESSRMIRARKRLKVRIVNRGLVISRYSNLSRSLDVGSMRWEMKVSGAEIPLTAYPHRQVKKGLSVEVNRGERKIIKSAFLANVGSTERAFLRKTKARLPLKTLYSSTLSDVFKDTGREAEITAFARSTFTASYLRLLPLELAKVPGAK